MTNLKKMILKSIPFDSQGRIDPKAFNEKFGIFEAFHILIFIHEGFTDESARAVIGARLMDEGMKYEKSGIPFAQWPEAIQELYPGLGGKRNTVKSKSVCKTEIRRPGFVSVKDIVPQVIEDICNNTKG